MVERDLYCFTIDCYICFGSVPVYWDKYNAGDWSIYQLDGTMQSGAG